MTTLRIALRLGPKGQKSLAQEPVGLWSRFRPEGPWKPSPGFSLGGVPINATSPHKALLWSAHGEKHPPCRVGAAEGAEEIVI